MSERAVGIKTTGANEYVAAFEASQTVGGYTRHVQIISLTSGKIDGSVSNPTRSVSTDDNLDVTTISGNVLAGDNAYLAVYVKHSQLNGQCLVTPLLCDDDGVVVGSLDSKTSKVMLPLVASGGYYLSNCLSWPILETGVWKLYTHVTDLSDSNSVDLWAFTF